jgi:V4R domain
MAQFKGTIFISTQMFAEQTFGPEAVARCLSQLEPSERELLIGISAVGWYPVEPILRFHHALERTYGKNSQAFEVCERLGQFSAEWAIKGILKVLIRFKTPQFLMEKNGAVWTRYHDTGRWTVESEQPTHIIGRLHEFAVRDAAFCARLRGWIRGAVMMTGGRNPRVVETSCRCRGAEHCEFSIDWQ